MIVLCAGGESCGTRLAPRLVEQMGARGLHRSFPYAREWPDLAQLEFDAAVVMTRDWWAAARSQLRRHPVADHAEAFDNLRRAYVELTGQLDRLGKPWVVLSYEELVAAPDSVVAHLAGWLGLDAGGVTEAVTDENGKWR